MSYIKLLVTFFPSLIITIIFTKNVSHLSWHSSITTSTYFQNLSSDWRHQITKHWLLFLTNWSLLCKYRG